MTHRPNSTAGPMPDPGVQDSPLTIPLLLQDELTIEHVPIDRFQEAAAPPRPPAAIHFKENEYGKQYRQRL